MKEGPRRWLSCFKTWSFSLKNVLKEDHPQRLDLEDVEVVVKANHGTTAQELCEKFNISHTTVKDKLKRTGKGFSGWKTRRA